MYERELVVPLALIILIIGCVFGALGYKKHIRNEAIKAGVAYYDPATAEFKWIKVEAKPAVELK